MALIERFSKTEDPLFELELWLSEEWQADRVDRVVVDVVLFAVHEVAAQRGEIDGPLHLAGLTADGTLINARGRRLTARVGSIVN